jgi:hypothetical protein
MPIHLGLAVANPESSTHEGVRLACTLQNDDPEPRTLPTPYDRSGSFQVGLFNGGEKPVRVMDRQSRQFMMTDGRVDGSLDLDTLGSGQSWNWRMDLSGFHYPIPPGDYSLRGSYLYAPAGVHVETGAQPLHVTADPLLEIQTMRDNPIMDGLTLLMRAQGAAGIEYFLRQYNYPRPFGAWWSRRILEGETAQAPFVASANFHQPASSEPFHRKWVLWTGSDGVLRARCYNRGEATDETRQADLPGDSELIRTAICTATDELLVFVRWEQEITCYRLERQRLARVFRYQMPGGPGSPVSIGGRADALYVATVDRGVNLDRLDYGGWLLDRRVVLRTRRQPVSVVIEASERRIKCVFADSVRGKGIELAVVKLDDASMTRSRIDQLPLRAAWRELSFDQDRSGRFHLAIATEDGRLYYYSDGRGPLLIAEGELPFFPIVVAPLQVYVGLYRKEIGYRFVQYQRRRRGSKIVGLAAHP